MKAFKLEAADAEHIVDAVNQVSNNTAVSSADLATNIGKASAAMAQGNNTYEEALAMMTGITEITRNGAKSARGLISIQSRLNQITDEGSSTGKKLTAWYKEHNIAIYDQEGQLKNLYEIAGEVAKIWDSLSKNEQMYYLNTQAGANQTQNLSALISNYDQVLYAHEQAINSVNSAQNENNRFMESAEAKIQNFKAAFQELALNLINSDLVKNIIDLGTSLLKFANTDLGQATIKIAAFSGAIKALGLVLTKTGLLESITKLGSAIKGLFTATTVTQNFSNIYGAFGTANQTATTLYGTITKTNLSMKAFVGNIKAAVAAMSGLAKAGLVVGAVFAAIQLVEWWGEKPERDLENAKSKLEETQKEYQDITSEADKLVEKQEKLAESGKELADSEKERLKYLKKQTAELDAQSRKERADVADKTLAGVTVWGGSSKTDYKTGAEAVDVLIQKMQELKQQYDDNKISQSEYVKGAEELNEKLVPVAQAYEAMIAAGDELTPNQQAIYDAIMAVNAALVGAGGQSELYNVALNSISDNTKVAKSIVDKFSESLKAEANQYYFTSVAAKNAAISNIKNAKAEAEEVVKACEAEIQALIAKQNALNASPAGKEAKKLSGGLGTPMTRFLDTAVKTRQNEINKQKQNISQLDKELKAVRSIKVSGDTSKVTSPSGGGGTGSGSGSSSKKTQDESEKIKKILDKLDDKYLESYQRREIIADKYYSKIQKRAWKYYKAGKIDHDEYNEYVQQAAKNIFEEIDYRYENGIYSVDTYYKKMTYFANKFYKSTGKNNKITYEEYREYIKKATEATIDAVEEQYDKGKISGEAYFDKIEKLAKSAKDKKILSEKEYLEYVEKGYEKLFDWIADQYERGKIDAEEYYALIKKKGAEAFKANAINADKFADALKEAYEAIKDMAQTKLDAFEFFAEDKKTALDKLIEKEQTRIDDLNAQLEAMRKQNDELDKQAERIELVNALTDATKNKIRIFDESLGWVYVSDPRKIQEAQKALDDFDEERRREKAEQAIEDEIANIEKVIENYEKQKQAYDDLINEQTRALERWEIENKLGMSIEQAVLQGRLDNFENFKTNYVAAINEMIAALERLANVQQEAEAPMTSLKQAGAAAADLVNSIMSDGVVKGTKEVANILKQLGTSNLSDINTSNVQDILNKAQEIKKTNDWNEKIDQKIADAKAAGKTVYTTVDAEGKKHYSTVSADKAKDLAGGVSKVTTIKGSSTKNKAAGSHSLPSTDLYRINELGDELLVPPTGNLAYLTKGTGIIPAHLTSNLMDLGQYNMAQWAKLIGSANGVGSIDSHNVIIQNMTVQSDNANDFVRQLQNLAILKK